MWWKSALVLTQILLIIVPIYEAKICESKDELPKRCDYIVVGAGAAGATLASRLSENPNINVCLFEAGVRHTEGRFANSVTIPKLFNAAIDPGDYAWNTSTVAQIRLNNRILPYGLGKTLGGSTTHNAYAFLRGFKADYDYWAANGATGWDYDSVLPFFKKSENITVKELRNSPLHSTCGPFAISTDEEGTDSLYGKLWQNAAKEVNLPFGECNRESPFGLCPMQKSIHRGKRVSTATAFLDPVMGRRNLFIVTEALVGRILISEQEKKAYGIRYLKHGRLHTVRAAKEIIVSGSTVESPKLLQNSGIGSRSLLRRLKIRPKAILPVGENVQDQTIFLLDFLTTIEVPTVNDLRDPKTIGEFFFQGKGTYATNGSPLNIFLDIVKQQLNWAEFQVQIIRGSANIFGIRTIPEGSNEDLLRSRLLLVLSHPKSRGSVKAWSTDPEKAPLIDPGYFTHPDDIPTKIKGIRMLQQIIKDSPSMRKVQGRLRLSSPENCVAETNSNDSDEFWTCILREQTNADLHLVRGCPIGSRNDRWAVVDPKLRVYGIKDLRVADASIMPEISSGNTMAPCVMIGEKAADIILKDYYRKY